jgi:Gpi18-like mannosyltransferase
MTAFFNAAHAKLMIISFYRPNASARRSLALLAAWLVIINIFALLALNRLNLAPDTALEWMSPAIYKPEQTWNIINLHNRWDAYWYLDIAKNGYYLRGESNQANVVFFPLYPLLIRTVKPLAGGNLVLSGWIVSSVFLALSVLMLTRLTQEFHPGIDDPLLPTAFLLVYPTAFYLNAVYSESLFLFLSLAMVFCAMRRNFLLAGVWAALASATRIAGLFLFILLITEFIQVNGWRALLTRRAWPLAMAPAGMIAFFIYHWIAFGDFFLFLKIQKFFGRGFKADSAYFDIHNNPDLVHTVLEIGYTIVAIVLGFMALLRFRISYGLYMLVSLSVALSTGTTLGISRYSMVMFPIYLIGASIRSVVSRAAWLFGSTLLLALNVIRFINHYWAG